MKYTLKEVKILVDKAMELNLFHSLQEDINNYPDAEGLLELSKELKEQDIDINKVYRIVETLPNGKNQIYYTSKEGIIDILKNDEYGFHFISNEIEKIKNKSNQEIDDNMEEKENEQ